MAQAELSSEDVTKIGYFLEVWAFKKHIYGGDRAVLYATIHQIGEDKIRRYINLKNSQATNAAQSSLVSQYECFFEEHKGKRPRGRWFDNEVAALKPGGVYIRGSLAYSGKIPYLEGVEKIVFGGLVALIASLCLWAGCSIMNKLDSLGRVKEHSPSINKTLDSISDKK